MVQQLPSTPKRKYLPTSYEDGEGDIYSCFTRPASQGCGQVTPPHVVALTGKRRSRLGNGWNVTPRKLLSTAAGFTVAAAEEVLAVMGSHSRQPPVTTNTTTARRQEGHSSNGTAITSAKRQDGHSSSGASSSGDSSINNCLDGGGCEHGPEQELGNFEDAAAWATLCTPCTPRCGSPLTPNPFAYDSADAYLSVSPCRLRASKVSIRSGMGGQPEAFATCLQPQLCSSSSPTTVSAPPPSPAPGALDSAFLGSLCVHAPRPTLAC